jgi:O-antigen ligase
VIYYAGYFFVAQAAFRHEASARWLRRAALVSACSLPAITALNALAPDFFLHTFTWRGVPVVFQKEDLVAAYCFVGFYLLLTVRRKGRLPFVCTLVATLCYGAAFTFNSSRAAIVGLVVTLGWWALARRWTPFRIQAAIIPAGLLALVGVALVRDQDFRQSRVYVLYEHVASLVDVTGSGNYESEERRYVGDNNRFRIVWWRSVAEETWQINPVFGLGFGYDLADRFLRTYDRDLGEDFTTRSPHSILFSTLGRTGLLGLVSFLCIVAAMAGRTVQQAKLARESDDGLEGLGWWSASWVILVSACFGVVLEGPMGAVVFWTLLGLANQATRREMLDSAEPMESATAAPQREGMPATTLGLQRK